MYMHFDVKKNGNVVEISKLTNATLYNIRIFIDQQYYGCISFVDSLKVSLQNHMATTLSIQADIFDRGYYYTSHEIHPLQQTDMQRDQLDNGLSFQAGDILVGCDNVNGLPVGYMGHSAIVVDSEHAVEATPLPPIVRKIPISNFLNNHPTFALIRPKSAEKGKGAAQYALNFLANFLQNQKNGSANPVFKFSLETPLTDANTYIYCSKLVWLSYYYGANYEFPNDHLWFAPEDLYSFSIDNPEFEFTYIHPNFQFHLNL